MTSAVRKLRSVTREEAEVIARSGLSTTSLWIWCGGLVLIPTAALFIVLSLMA